MFKYGLTALTIAAGFLFVAGCETEHEGTSEKSTRISGEIEGHVLIAGQPVAGSTVTLYAAGEGAPTQLAQGKTDARASLNWTPNPRRKTAWFIWSPKAPRTASR